MTKSKMIALLKRQSNMCEQLAQLIDEAPFINETYNNDLRKLQEEVVYKNWKEIDSIIEKLETGEIL